MKYLITGGGGFLGSNLACEVLQKGNQLVIFDNLSRFGSDQNIAWLQGLDAFTFVRGDVSIQAEIESVIRQHQPDVIFHLAGQVAMTTSIENPRRDFEVNALGSFNVLESVRKFSPHSVILYSSTNKVYGDLEWLRYAEKNKRYELADFPNGLAESVPLSFSSPYGCSKGSADQYMLDFNHVYGLKTVVFRHSSMYGGRQFSTFDQGWLGWFCEQAINTAQGKNQMPFTISGTGKQVRDVLHAEDMVRLYFLAAEKIDSIQGNVFNIGGGFKNSLSLLELFDILENELQIKLNYTQLPVRASDQKVFIADIAKAQTMIGWQPEVDALSGIRKMLEWVRNKSL